MNYYEEFRVKPGSKFDLSAIDPDFEDDALSKDEVLERTKANLKRLEELQELLYAEHKRGVLICLQAMDAGGKDGVIRKVFTAMNPQGCRVAAFKQPSSIERDHDFLWRAHAQAPAKGEVAVFNRSHYEDVLVVRVNELVPKSVWEKRYDQINAFEKLLIDNHTHIIKFYLYISKDEQLKRFKDRLDDPAKHWKISATDYSTRTQWHDYQDAVNDMLSRCSTEDAPWFVIPANHKKFRDLAVSHILVEHLEQMKMAFPAPAVDLEEIRKHYFAAAKAG